MSSSVTIRVVRAEDAVELLKIYGYYVENTAITFEYDVPSVEEFQGRIVHTLEKYPYLVAEEDGKIVGYAYAGAYHPRVAYGWMAEMTVYLRHDYKGHGLGRLLYTKLENILQKQGVVKTIALITVPPTEEEKSIYGSMFFHEKMGYHLAGRLESSGYKFNRWYDTVLMDKFIGERTENMKPIRTFSYIDNHNEKK